MIFTRAVNRQNCRGDMGMSLDAAAAGSEARGPDTLSVFPSDEASDTTAAVTPFTSARNPPVEVSKSHVDAVCAYAMSAY